MVVDRLWLVLIMSVLRACAILHVSCLDTTETRFLDGKSSRASGRVPDHASAGGDAQSRMDWCDAYVTEVSRRSSHRDVLRMVSDCRPIPELAVGA
eukprot:3908781-Pyramimonas_sp.AAC.1